MEQFIERFERPRIPVVIIGLCDGWRAGQAWQQEELLKHYGEHKFKVASLCVAEWLERVWHRYLKAPQHITVRAEAAEDTRGRGSLLRMVWVLGTAEPEIES